MEYCDKCGRMIKDNEFKTVLDGEWDGIYHGSCADKILSEED